MGFSPAWAEQNRDEQAKKLVGEFVKAARAKDVDGQGKLTDVPYLHDFKRLIKDRAELTRRLPVTANDFSEKPVAVKQVLTYEQFVKEYKDRLGEDRRKLLAETLAEGDRLLVLTKGEREVLMLVRFRDGKPRVAGLSY